MPPSRISGVCAHSSSPISECVSARSSTHGPAAVIANPDRVEDLNAALAEVASTPQDRLSATLDRALAERIAERGQQLISNFEAALASDHRTVFSALARHSESELVDPVLASLSDIGSRQWVHEIARQENLPRTHSRSCPTESPVEAFRSHLQIPEHSSESCAQLAARCMPQGVVGAAISLDATILIPIAAEVARQDANALLPAQPSCRSWLVIWAHAIESGADPWQCLNPIDAMAPVLDAVLDGDRHAKTLVAALSTADGIDLSSYPRRAEVWGHNPRTGAIPSAPPNCHRRCPQRNGHC